MQVMRIQSSLGDYTVRFEENLQNIGVPALGNSTVFIVDQMVSELYREQLQVHMDPQATVLVPTTEAGKTLESVQEICTSLMGRNTRRNTRLIVIGGGILQDLAGFAASTLYRGVQWTFIPTTLLAQADSCIGGKTSLNFQGFKNLLGTFWPPKEVIICPEFTSTLSREDYFSGVGEVLKLHLMGGDEDTNNFRGTQTALHARDPKALLSTIHRSLEIKKGYIETDEFDGSHRQLLNFGHCFGHAIESATNYRIPHGQAVVAGMLLANDITHNRGLLDSGLYRDLERLLESNLIEAPQPGEIHPNVLLDAIGRDKKRSGTGLALILLKSGHIMEQVQDMLPEEARNAYLTRFNQQY